MSQMRRSVLKALNDVSSRGVMRNTPQRHASALSSAATAEEYEALTLPPIFDIFDAPTRLGESSKQLGRTSSAPCAAAIGATQRSGEKSRNTSIDVSNTVSPFSLPPPLVFDGPARPPHLMHLALEKRRKLRQRLSPSLSRTTHTPSISYTPSPEPLLEIFDGPSRITRYKYPTSPRSQTSTKPYIWLFLGISGAFGWVAFNSELNSSKERNKDAFLA
ncbi:hypothetical protein SERLADRAFT_436669 [Serpula lacrymans var. lacrymans S7.9]|uniref:Uncharacterized protein n=1 Tax=Serpula lacrymans var. lacrymans (strain S7.9) TaxID=578457 RepID=F8NRV5_SERL9|nr:uncharacterized protein SERLADRAFT_436669 [Serpula lacrymans var. lacrymans S7.9]EGO26841.1 hypothetical protein SERLADRAFT_436669 [Serpula lacrymans var. lacrymans S7.9]